jgi:hypothetical protein
MSLITTWDAIEDDLAAIDGLTVAESMEQLNGPHPTAVVRMDTGDWQFDTQGDPTPTRAGGHRLIVRLLYPRKDQKRDLRKIAAVDDAIVNALMKGGTRSAGGDGFANTVIGLGVLNGRGGGTPPLTYSTGAWNVGGVDFVSIEYTLAVTAAADVT